MSTINYYLQKKIDYIKERNGIKTFGLSFQDAGSFTIEELKTLESFGFIDDYMVKKAIMEKRKKRIEV